MGGSEEKQRSFIQGKGGQVIFYSFDKKKIIVSSVAVQQ
jgi:hypothetical protein